MYPREKHLVYTHVEVAWGVSCVNVLGYVHRQAPCRNTYTTSTTDLDTDLYTNLDIILGTNLDTDNVDVGEGTVATVTGVPIIIDMIDLVRHYVAAAASIG